MIKTLLALLEDRPFRTVAVAFGVCLAVELARQAFPIPRMWGFDCLFLLQSAAATLLAARAAWIVLRAFDRIKLPKAGALLLVAFVGVVLLGLPFDGVADDALSRTFAFLHDELLLRLRSALGLYRPGARWCVGAAVLAVSLAELARIRTLVELTARTLVRWNARSRQPALFHDLRLALWAELGYAFDDPEYRSAAADLLAASIRGRAAATEGSLDSALRADLALYLLPPAHRDDRPEEEDARSDDLMTATHLTLQLRSRKQFGLAERIEGSAHAQLVGDRTPSPFAVKRSWLQSLVRFALPPLRVTGILRSAPGPPEPLSQSAASWVELLEGALDADAVAAQLARSRYGASDPPGDPREYELAWRAIALASRQPGAVAQDAIEAATQLRLSARECTQRAIFGTGLDFDVGVEGTAPVRTHFWRRIWHLGQARAWREIARQCEAETTARARAEQRAGAHRAAAKRAHLRQARGGEIT